MMHTLSPRPSMKIYTNAYIFYWEVISWYIGRIAWVLSETWKYLGQDSLCQIYNIGISAENVLEISSVTKQLLL